MASQAPSTDDGAVADDLDRNSKIAFLYLLNQFLGIEAPGLEFPPQLQGRRHILEKWLPIILQHWDGLCSKLYPAFAFEEPWGSSTMRKAAQAPRPGSWASSGLLLSGTYRSIDERQHANTSLKTTRKYHLSWNTIPSQNPIPSRTNALTATPTGRDRQTGRSTC
jgi:hypothetical protein